MDQLRYINDSIKQPYHFYARNSGPLLITFALSLHIFLLFVPICNTFPGYFYIGLLGLSNLLFLIGLFRKNTFSFVKRLLGLACILILYSFLYVLIKFGRHDGFMKNTINMMQFWLPMAAALYFTEHRQKKGSKFLYNFLFVIMAVVSLTTIIGLSVFPDASREMAGGTGEYYKYNIGGYSHIYGLVFLVPWVILKNKRKFKPLYFLLIIIFSYCVLKSQFTLALLFLLISFISIVISNKPKFHNLIIAILLGGLFVFLYREFFADILKGVSSLLKVLDINYLSSRFLGYSDTLKDLGNGAMTTSVSLRIYVYSRSIMAFFFHPLRGSLFSGDLLHIIGGHADILDTLGGLGILGGVLLYIILFWYYKMTLLPIKGNRIYAPSVFLLGFYILFACFNSTYNVPQIGYIVFLLPVLIYNINMENKAGDINGR